MKKISIFAILTFLVLSALCQNTMINENVIILGEKYFNNPVSIMMKVDIGNGDSCQSFDGKDFKQPPFLLVEKAYFDTLNNYSELTVFNKDCFLYRWFSFPSFVRNYVIPYMDTTSVLYQRVYKTYPNCYIDTFGDMGGIVRHQTTIDYGTLFATEVTHHNFLIVLMSAKIYNTYLHSLGTDNVYKGAKNTYYEGMCEENGLYYKVAIPILGN